ncbi:MAG: hypothetical protein KC502_19970 [Myxococcales bacterium]|nr:hypothetical protein [Myxococcales bacterium]
MAISRKGKRAIVVDGEEFLWRYWKGGTHVVDLDGQLNLLCKADRVWVRAPRFRSVVGCGGRHRCFECPDFFWISTNPRQVAEFIRWAVAAGPDPRELSTDHSPASG